MNREGACVDFKPTKNWVVLTGSQGPPEGAGTGDTSLPSLPLSAAAPQSRETSLPVRKILSLGLRNLTVSWISDLILSLRSGKIVILRSLATREPSDHRAVRAQGTLSELSAQRWETRLCGEGWATPPARRLPSFLEPQSGGLQGARATKAPREPLSSERTRSLPAGRLPSFSFFLVLGQCMGHRTPSPLQYVIKALFGEWQIRHVDLCILLFRQPSVYPPIHSCIHSTNLLQDLSYSAREG